MRAAFVIVVLVVGSIVSAVAQDMARGRERETLYGIGPLAVVAEVSPDIQGDGLTGQSLQAAIESRLRASGLVVAEGAPVGFRVRVDAARIASESGDEAPSYVFCVSVDVRQLVEITATSIFGVASTWERRAVGRVGPADVPDLQERVLEYVDQFSDDYLTVNTR